MTQHAGELKAAEFTRKDKGILYIHHLSTARIHIIPAYTVDSP